eukprot:6480096-Amphidinium_carterae.1
MNPLNEVDNMHCDDPISSSFLLSKVSVRNEHTTSALDVVLALCTLHALRLPHPRICLKKSYPRASQSINLQSFKERFQTKP